MENTATPGTVPLRNVFLHVTKACNLHCRYCYFSAHQPMSDEMTTAEFAALWPQLAALRPRKVVLTGGEPLLRPDILELLHGLKNADPDHHVRRCLNTNGHRVTPQLAEQLVGLADEVRVSLDGLRERNDAFRGRGNFDAAFGALKTFYDAGFEPKVLVTITAGNVEDLEELVCLLVENKFTRINWNNFRPIGRGTGRWDWRADPKRVRVALARLATLLPGGTAPAGTGRAGAMSLRRGAAPEYPTQRRCLSLPRTYQSRVSLRQCAAAISCGYLPYFRTARTIGRAGFS